MKLRNKKTGEVIDTCDYSFKVATPSDPLYGHDAYDVREEFNSLAELNEEWEDYEPKEPLIKDELARKAIRAWAEANSLRCDDKVEARTPTVDCCTLGLTYGFTSIDVIVNEETTLKDYSRYTIDELCGEEDE